jgi:hypothetical protein
MSDNNKPDFSSEVVVFSDKHIEVTVTDDEYLAMNRWAVRDRNMGLNMLAELDPVNAYEFIKSGLRRVTANRVLRSIDDTTYTAADLESMGASASTGRDEFLKRLPAPYCGPFDFSLAIFPSQEDAAYIGENVYRIPVIDLHVEPPNLAM